MSPQAVNPTSPAVDLLRLAIPLVLIAGAVAATLWIDRTAGFDAASVQAPAAVDSSAR
jgi:hypothetical protein